MGNFSYTPRRIRPIRAKFHGNKLWCKVHPQGLWLVEYPQCSVGYRTKEKCEKGD